MFNTEKTAVGLYKLYCEEKGIHFDNIEIGRNEYGKPYLIGTDIHISISHTDSLTVVAFSPYNIGIDCEKVSRTVKNPLNIIERAFSPAECKYVLSKSGDLQSRFIEIWVKKEAYVKYVGVGIKAIKSTDTFSLKGIFNRFQAFEHIIYTYNE